MDPLPPPVLEDSPTEPFLNKARLTQYLSTQNRMDILSLAFSMLVVIFNNTNPLPGILPWLLVALALLSGPAGVFWSHFQRKGKGARQVKQELMDHLAQNHRLPANFGGQFVGFCPVNQFRTYNGWAVEDLGFLQVFGPWLVFIGDRHAFALHQQQVLGVGWGFKMPDYFSKPLVCLRVQQPDHEREICFFSSEGSGSAKKNHMEQQHLHQVLKEWQATEVPPMELPRPFGAGPLPPPLLGSIHPSKAKLIMFWFLNLLLKCVSLIPAIFIIGIHKLRVGLVPSNWAWIFMAGLVGHLFILWPILLWREKGRP